MWRQVKLKEKQNVIHFDLRNVSAKTHKETKKAFISFKSIFLLKNIFCLYFSPIANFWPRKKVIFKVFIFWRYSKTLNLFPAVKFFLDKIYFGCLKIKNSQELFLKVPSLVSTFFLAKSGLTVFVCWTIIEKSKRKKIMYWYNSIVVHFLIRLIFLSVGINF